MAKSLDRLEYGNLIEFVRPTSADKRPSAQTAVPKQPRAAISGEEARSFYEELCGSETTKNIVTTIHRPEKQKLKRKSSRRHKKSRLSSDEERTELCSSVKVSVESKGCVEKECVPVGKQWFLKAENDTLATNIIKSSVQSTVACRDREKTVCSSTVRGRMKSGLDKSSDLSYPHLTESPGDLTQSASTKTHIHLSKEAACEKQKVSDRVMNHRHSRLLQAAQNGDTDEVRNLLELGVNVDFQDIYGWTAAMSASYEGHVTVLKCLIQAGADLDICNPQGRTALSLAKQKQHTKTVQLLESVWKDIHDRRPRTDPDFIGVSSESSVLQTPSFFCDVCKSEFTDTDQKEHLRSTVHLFNTGQKPKDDSFLIPSSNIGYRLMLKSGWDAQRGLGPSGQGHKFPMKTCLKTDRKGLGNEVNEKARVTHFKPHDRSAVERRNKVQQRMENVRTLSRRSQRAKEKRDRQWEIEMRRHLS